MGEPNSRPAARRASSGRKAKPRVLPADDRRDELMRAALGAFREIGYDGTRISDIVTRANVAQGTFYLYFPSKAALYLAISGAMTQSMVDEIFRQIVETTTIRAAVIAGVGAAFRTIAQERELMLLIADGPMLSEVRHQTSEMAAPMLSLTAERIRGAIAAQELDAGIDPLLTAQLIHGAVDYSAREYLAGDKAAYERAAREATNFALRALGLAPEHA